MKRLRLNTPHEGGMNMALPYLTAQNSWLGNDPGDLSIPDIETVWLELTLPNRKKTLICSLYKPPNADFDAFKATLDNVLDQSASEGVETLILGDFNVICFLKDCQESLKNSCNY